jgi:Ca2+-binding RTX toxin-like protein
VRRAVAAGRGRAFRTSVKGRHDNDYIRGEEDPDDIYGEAGNDDLGGGADNDDVYGGPGNDSLLGHAGNELVHAWDGQFDNTIDCGPGTDDVAHRDAGIDVPAVNCETVISH